MARTCSTSPVSRQTRVVSRAGRTHAPAPAATSGCGSAGNLAANAAADAGSVPSTLASADASLGPARPPNPVDGLVLGHVLESAVITADHTAAPGTRDPIGQYVPTGRPGRRSDARRRGRPGRCRRCTGGGGGRRAAAGAPDGQRLGPSAAASITSRRHDLRRIPRRSLAQGPGERGVAGLSACLQRPLKGHVGACGAVHDAELGAVAERLKSGRHTRSWNAASATVVTPALSSNSSTPKNTGSVRAVSSSPGLGTNPGVACIMPSLISSRQIAGHPTARAIWCASVVLPDPGGLVTTTRVGRGITLSYSQVRNGASVDGSATTAKHGLAAS